MYVELHCHTAYSFLDGASDIDELVRRAAELGMPALAMTDHNSLTAAVKFNTACREYGVRPIFGSELTLDDGSHITLLARTRRGYANICRLVSLAYAHGGRLSPALPWSEIAAHTDGVVCLSGCRKSKIARLVLGHRFDEALLFARQLKEWFGDNLYIELQDDLTPHARVLTRQLTFLAARIGARYVATNNVHHAARQGMIAYDIKRCIASGITVADIHPDRPLNSERCLKSASEMALLFDRFPDAVSNTMVIAEQCARDGIMPLDEEVTPRYPLPDGMSADRHLRERTYAGARRRHGRISPDLRQRIEEELHMLGALGYSDFVLHAARIVEWARSDGIMVTGRGSGADSEICYCLGLTDIDVLARNLPLARWVAPGKKPDIDIDFDARRRDDVFRWTAKTYGEDKVALCCTYATYWAKGAIRDIGKALALPADALTWFSKHVSGFTNAAGLVEAFEKYSELKEHAAYASQFGLLFDLCGRIAGHPRHLGSHSSGLVISGTPLSELNVLTPSARGVVPIVMLDKDDVEEAGAVKLDILSLPILSAVGDATRTIQQRDPSFEYEAIPREDQGVYDMLKTGRNMGLFQLGSPAQAALATQLHPRDFEDLVAAIGLIRPGPIKAKSVRKYVVSRNGWAPIEYLHPALIPILDRTYGVVCFQEQVSHIIAAMMGLSDADADVWRKRLTKHARFGTMDKARAEFVERARQRHRNLPLSNAHRIMDELQGWSGLGFVEGHSASFALTGQKTAYLARYHPAAYYAALMSNQPCGFYPPQSLAAEARRQGIPIRPVDVNESAESCTVGDEEGSDSIRVGYCLVNGMRDEEIESVLAARRDAPFRSLLDFCRRVTLTRSSLESLILIGAFDNLHEHRRGLMWRLDETLAKAAAQRREGGGALAARASYADGATLNGGSIGGFAAGGGQAGVLVRQGRLDVRFRGEEETPVAWEIEDMSDWQKLMWEWRITSVTSSCHPFAHVREWLTMEGVVSAHDAMQLPHGTRVAVAGLNIRPHRPPAKEGGRHLFTTLEDETDYLQVSFGNSVEDCIATVLLSPVVLLRGTIRRRREIASYLLADDAEPLTLPPQALTSARELLTAPPRRNSSAR
ncbi:MAG TPA: DNA polymerase III subunit alpha [Capsulimonadaceae bacterium]|jgi:error-prone DNA polymerase